MNRSPILSALVVVEISAVLEISADRGLVVLARLPRTKRCRRTPRLVEIPGIIALRKAAVAAVIKVVAEAAAIAALRPPAAVVPVAVVVVVPAAAAVDRMATAEDTADSPSPQR